MLKLFAQPCDITATGFYFEAFEEYEAKAIKCINAFGQPVEEFEIQFIDGEDYDCDFARVYAPNQANLAKFFELNDEWDDHQKIRFIIANGECGCAFDPNTGNIDQLDIDIYEVDSLKDLAEQFVDEGLYGDIPKSLEFYIDFEAMSRDLSADYGITTICGTTYAYRCG